MKNDYIQKNTGPYSLNKYFNLFEEMVLTNSFRGNYKDYFLKRFKHANQEVQVKCIII
jgi:hypothetical protein